MAVRNNAHQKAEARRARLERHALEDDPQAVLAAAGRFLEARQRSVSEVRRHLAGAAYPADLVSAALDRLIELGILDDRAFARAWVESRDRAHPRGETALRRELALKGIDRDVIAEVLEARSAGLDEYGEPNPGAGEQEDAELRAALALLRRKGATLARVEDPRTRRQRAYALLARNGFGPGVCRTAAAAMEADAEAALDDMGGTDDA
jgi:regulatory protein